MRAFLGLGSNLGDRKEHLQMAVSSLTGVTAVSSVYETAPIGGPVGQQSFYNMVVELSTDLTPRELLGVAQRLESNANRVRTQHWGPRTLDVDVLWHEQGSVDEPDLIVPHPRMTERRFVMVPLHEIASDIVAKNWAEYAAGAIEKKGDLWDTKW